MQNCKLAMLSGTVCLCHRTHLGWFKCLYDARQPSNSKWNCSQGQGVQMFLTIWSTSSDLSGFQGYVDQLFAAIGPRVTITAWHNESSPVQVSTPTVNQWLSPHYVFAAATSSSSLAESIVKHCMCVVTACIPSVNFTRLFHCRGRHSIQMCNRLNSFVGGQGSQVIYWASAVLGAL